jgi:hypothetical protein
MICIGRVEKIVFIVCFVVVGVILLDYIAASHIAHRNCQTGCETGAAACYAVSLK